MNRNLNDFVTRIYPLMGFNFRDFVTASPHDQLDKLLQSCKSFTPRSQYLFTMLNDHQRSLVLKEANDYQRFQLFQNYDFRCKGLILAEMSSKEVNTILDSIDPDKISQILDVSNEYRSLIVSKMSAPLQIKWIFYCKDEDYAKIFSQLSDTQKQNLALAYTDVRVSDGYIYLDYEFIAKGKSFTDFLDELSNHYTRRETDIVLSTQDPILYLSRFTPKERKVLLGFMKAHEKQMLLDKLESHIGRKVSNLFDVDMKNSFFAGTKEWDDLWEEVRFSIAELDRQERLKNFFRHERSRSSDSIPLSATPTNVWDVNNFYADIEKGLLTFKENSAKRVKNLKMSPSLAKALNVVRKVNNGEKEKGASIGSLIKS